MEWLADWFGRGNFLPHGYCYTWTPSLLWTMVVADGAIALAYYSIPVAMWSFAQRRKDVSFRGVVWLFCAFIFACGTTHLLSIWTLWYPDYGLDATVKAATAAVSVVTAVVLWPMIPRALRLPSVSELQGAVAALEGEVRQRRDAEERLLEAQESLVITLAAIGGALITTDRDGCITRMNAVAEQITGSTLAQARGRPLYEVYCRERVSRQELDMNPVDFLLLTGRTADAASRANLISRDGLRTPVEASASVLRASNGSVSGMAVVFRDMTRFDQANAESKRLAAIVESSHDAIISKTLAGVITSWNRAAQAMFGYDAAEAIGQPVTLLFPPEQQADEVRILRDLAAGAKVPPFETVRRRKDGSLFEVSVTVSPLQDADGRIVGASKIVRDISQQKRNEELRLTGLRLEARNRQFQEASRLKSEFLANMSHELRTPLNAIIGFSDLLHSGRVQTDAQKQREFIGHIRSSGRHLLQLINDVLDLAKVEAGKFEFYPEPVDLTRTVQEVAAILRTTAELKGVTIEVDIGAGLDDVVLDPARLKQVLYNYLSNAIKFTPAQGRIQVRARAEGDALLRLEVEDTGIGIAPQDLDRLFIEFQQLDGSYTKEHPGTGLGLALTRKLVQAQGGSVGVRSTLGVGSVFHAVLPRRAEARVAEAVAASSAAVQPGVPRILVVEDDAADQTRLAQALRRAGYEVELATSVARARQLAAERAYAAVTLDLLLPDGSGLEVLSALRGEPLNANVPVIVVTLVTEPSTLAGFSVTDVLTKPIRGDEVVAALDKAGIATQGRSRVLVIDDDPQALALMASTLGGLGIASICEQDPRQALIDLDMHRPDAIILDLVMPEFDGFAVLDALRQQPRFQHIPVFIWTSLQLSARDYETLGASARNILRKGGGDMNRLLLDLQVALPRRAAAS